MKKMYALLLVATLILSGCAGTPAAPSASPPPSSAVEALVQEQPQPTPELEITPEVDNS